MLPVFSFTKAALELLIWLNERFELENGEVGLKALFELFEDWDFVFYPITCCSECFWPLDFGCNYI